MSIIVSKENLFRSLEIVGKALTGDSPILVLNNILMESDSRQLILSTTNLELEIKVILSYDGDEPGSVLIPGRLTDIVRLLPEAQVQLDLNPDNLHIAVTSGRSNYNLFGSDPADFPRIEEETPSENGMITLPSSELKEILRMVVFAASTEEARPAFNGILFEFDGQRWSLVSSDTYRLVLKSLQGEGWDFQPSRCLVPAKALRELLKVIDLTDEEVLLFPSNDKLIFKFGSVYFAARLLNEKYPDISSVIPEQYSTRVVLDRHEFIDSVSRATLLAEGPNSAIQLDVANGGMTVRVSSQIGRMEESIAAEIEGEEIALHINSRFVMDMLKAASSKEMVMDFHGESGPVIFRLPDEEQYLYLVLPIKMN